MTVFVREAQGERRNEVKGGRTTAVRVFYVYADTTGPAVKHERDAVDITVIGEPSTPDDMPKKADVHPQYAGLFAVDRVIEEVPGSNMLVPPQTGAASVSHIWRVEWVYMTNAPWIPGGEPEGFIQWSSSTRAEFIEAWRAYDTATITVTADGANAPPEQDIGGTSIDSNGAALSYPLTQIVWRIEQHKEATTNAEIRDLLLLPAALAGKRNDAPFLTSLPSPDGDKGKVLYLGAELQRAGETRYILNHEFVIDDFYHLRQQPLRDIDGQPYISFSPPSPDPVPDREFAAFVFWVQPFKETADFGALGITV